MSDILADARRRDAEALERCAALRDYIASRKGGNASPAPVAPQVEPLQQPSKPEARVNGRLTFIGRLWCVSKAHIIKPEKGRIWKSLYQDSRYNR